MQISESDNQGVAVLGISGRIDAATSEQFKQKLLTTVGDRPVRLVLDFSQVVFVSSIALRVLVITAKRVAAVRGKMVFCGLIGPVHEVFELAGFTSVVPVFPNRTAAVASFGQNNAPEGGPPAHLGTDH
jgi:anti-anti-sigma factor